MDAYLRLAGQEDMDLLFLWANDPSVRKNSFSEDEIPYEEHRQWYQTLLTDQKRRQYLYICNGVPMGQVRISLSEEDAEISYSIGKEYRGMGHAKKMLQLLQEQVQEDYPYLKRLSAKVKADNTPSQRAFLHLGYQKIYEVYTMPCGCKVI